MPLYGNDNVLTRYSGTRRRPEPLAVYPMRSKTMLDGPIGRRPTHDGQFWNPFDTRVAPDLQSGKSHRRAGRAARGPSLRLSASPHTTTHPRTHRSAKKVAP